MKKVLGILAALIFVIFLISGCGSSVGSSDVNAKAFYPTYTVTRVNGVTGIVAKAEFCVGGPVGSSVKLTNGDSIFCNNVQLEKNFSVDFISINYKTTFQQPSDQYVFRFERDNTEISSTVGSLPQIPVIQGSLPDIKNSDSLEVNWDATMPGDDVVISALYTSETNGSGITGWTVKDNGHYTLPAGFDLKLNPGTYSFTIEVARRKVFPIDTAFFKNGGTALAISKDSKKIQYIKE